MSGPSTSLPPELAELMTVPVVWEANSGFNGMGEPGYAAPVTLDAWVEPHGYANGGAEAIRNAAGTMVDVEFSLYFTGDDARVRGFSVGDRFTVPGVGVDGRTLEALFVLTSAGPNFDNVNPWLVEVVL